MVSSLLKRCNTKRLITSNGEFPVCHEFVPMNVNPDLHHPKLARWEVSSKNTAVVNCYRSLFPLVSHMDVRGMVLYIITIENGNENSEEH